MLSTCNRIEVYADVDRFHGSVEAISRLLGERAGEDARGRSSPHLYVHYDDGAVSHLFHVASGLDSMVARREPDPRPGPRGAARWARRPAPSARPSTCSSSRRCGSASARTPRPTSTASRPSLVGAALDRAADHLGGARGPRGRWSSAPARWPRSPSPRCSRGRRLDRRRQPHRRARRPPRRPVRRAARSRLADVGRRGRRRRRAGLLHRRDRHAARRRRRSPRAAHGADRPLVDRRPGAAARRRPGRRRRCPASA